MPAKVNKAPNRIVHSNMMTANGTGATTGLPPGLLMGHWVCVSDVMAKPVHSPVMAPTIVHQRTGDGRPSYTISSIS